MGEVKELEEEKDFTEGDHPNTAPQEDLQEMKREAEELSAPSVLEAESTMIAWHRPILITN